MRHAFGLAVAGLLAACAAETPPHVSSETVEAAVEHARLESERATGKTPAPASETSR